MNIPDACMTTLQWALANADRALWDYGLPAICVLGVLGTILATKKIIDYADNVGSLSVEETSFDRA